jgi:hypothetical protein
MKTLSGNIKMEERIGFLYSEENKFLGVHVDRETTLIAVHRLYIFDMRRTMTTYYYCSSL